MTSSTARRFVRRLFRWHGANRRDLALRDERDPWRILVAEVMSQQTSVERASAYWARFTSLWPTPEALDVASTPELLEAWAGLGYNRRALALRDCARAVAREHGGRVPSSVEALELLPGVGPYTARAVAASAFGLPVAPLDTNVARVCGRVLGTDRVGQRDADALVSRTDPRRWMDAVMDLAAGVCLPRTPRCDACPLRPICLTRGEGPRAERSNKPSVPFEETMRWLRGRVLAHARRTSGWSPLPDALGVHGAEAVVAAARALERDGFVEVRGNEVRIGP